VKVLLAYGIVAVAVYNSLRFDTTAPRWFCAPLAVLWGPLVVVGVAGSAPWWPKEWFK
jgi:hypothetical protein